MTLRRAWFLRDGPRYLKYVRRPELVGRIPLIGGASVGFNMLSIKSDDDEEFPYQLFHPQGDR